MISVGFVAVVALEEDFGRMICEVFGTRAQAIGDVQIARAEGWDAGSYNTNANLPAEEVTGVTEL